MKYVFLQVLKQVFQATAQIFQMCQEQADISLSQKEKEMAIVGIELHHSPLHHPDVQQKAEAYLQEA